MGPVSPQCQDLELPHGVSFNFVLSLYITSTPYDCLISILTTFLPRSLILIGILVSYLPNTSESSGYEALSACHLTLSSSERRPEPRPLQTY